MTRVVSFALLVSFTCFLCGCGDSTPAKPVSGGGGSTTPATTQAVPIPGGTKPKME